MCSTGKGMEWRIRKRILRPFAQRFLKNKSTTFPSEDQMIMATNLWIHKVVIRLGLCPWAAKDVQNTQIRVFQEEKATLRNSCGLLAHKDTQIAVFNFAKELAFELPRVNSGMAVVPQLKSFPQYLQFTDEFNDLLRTTGLDSVIQIATFHPQYQFEDTEEEDAENWTSRSPYPTLHLLKVSDVSAAIEAYPGSTDKIWERNIRVLRKLGGEAMERMNLEILNEATAVVASGPISSNSSPPDYRHSGEGSGGCGGRGDDESR
jgi:uncharacterized protein